MADMTSRLLTLCNSFSSHDLREACLTAVKEMLLLWPNEVRKIFPKSESVKYIFMDAHYDPADEEERKAFDSAADNLWNILTSEKIMRYS